MSLAARQLLTFFGLAYLLSWVIWLPLYLPAWGIHIGWVLPYHHALGGLGPMIAAFIATAVFQKKEGIAALVKSMFGWKPLVYVLLALFSPAVLNVLAGCISLLVEGQAVDFSGLGHSAEFPGFNLLTIFLYNLLFFGFGEEVGWRGFALPRLQSKYNALVSSLLLSIFWAIWHWPLFFYRPGYTGMDMGGIMGWLSSLVTGSVLLTWLFNSSRGSLLACAIFHATIDIAFTSHFSQAQIIQYTGMLVTIWGIATMVWFKPHDLSRHPRIKSLLP